jgi:predicted DsbA family dithiol-disulfide isomerase
MQVEIWSDVVCPWCYIGKRRFENALAQFAHRDQVEVIWRSYQLDPTAPRQSGMTTSEMLARKRGISLEQAAAMTAQVSALAAQEGLDYHLDTAHYSNTVDAHRLIHLAASQGKQDAAKERLLRAYFTEGAAIDDPDTLVGLLADVGIDADEARAVLANGTYADAVKADEQRARAFGIRGVPFFAIDETYGISGAQSADVILSALEQAWAESHPLIAVGAAQPDSGVCTDDSCTI